MNKKNAKSIFFQFFFVTLQAEVYFTCEKGI